MKNAILIGVLAIAAGIPAAAQNAQPAPAAPKRAIKSQEEGTALQGVLQAMTPDGRVTAAEEFVTKYPKSDFRSLALFAEAQAYQQKNDYEKMVIYGERALEADPDDATKLQTMLMLAKGIGQRTREFDLDREEKLGRVEKYANSSLDMIKTMPKPNPNLPDEQWNGFKSQMSADAHEALGLAALVRKNYDQAITEFKTAVEITKEPEPAAQVRLASAYNKASKFDEAIAVCDKVMAQPNLHPQIRQYAQAERARAIQGKGGGAQQGAAPAANPAPSTPAAPAPAAPAPAPAPKP
jgi:tetratricopeptide (TPR) repeat protein